MACIHDFTGHAQGVTCEKCGLTMTAEEYRAFLHGDKQEAPAPVAEGKPKKRTTKKGA